MSSNTSCSKTVMDIIRELKLPYLPRKLVQIRLPQTQVISTYTGQVPISASQVGLDNVDEIEVFVYSDFSPKEGSPLNIHGTVVSPTLKVYMTFEKPSLIRIRFKMVWNGKETDFDNTYFPSISRFIITLTFSSDVDGSYPTRVYPIVYTSYMVSKMKEIVIDLNEYAEALKYSNSVIVRVYAGTNITVYNSDKAIVGYEIARTLLDEGYVVQNVLTFFRTLKNWLGENNVLESFDDSTAFSSLQLVLTELNKVVSVMDDYFKKIGELRLYIPKYPTASVSDSRIVFYETDISGLTISDVIDGLTNLYNTFIDNYTSYDDTTKENMKTAFTNALNTVVPIFVNIAGLLIASTTGKAGLIVQSIMNFMESLQSKLNDINEVKSRINSLLAQFISLVNTNTDFQTSLTSFELTYFVEVRAVLESGTVFQGLFPLKTLKFRIPVVLPDDAELFLRQVFEGFNEGIKKVEVRPAFNYVVTNVKVEPTVKSVLVENETIKVTVDVGEKPVLPNDIQTDQAVVELNLTGTKIHLPIPYNVTDFEASFTLNNVENIEVNGYNVYPLAYGGTFTKVYMNPIVKLNVTDKVQLQVENWNYVRFLGYNIAVFFSVKLDTGEVRHGKLLLIGKPYGLVTPTGSVSEVDYSLQLFGTSETKTGSIESTNYTASSDYFEIPVDVVKSIIENETSGTLLLMYLRTVPLFVTLPALQRGWFDSDVYINVNAYPIISRTITVNDTTFGFIVTSGSDGTLSLTLKPLQAQKVVTQDGNTSIVPVEVAVPLTVDINYINGSKTFTINVVEGDSNNVTVNDNQITVTLKSDIYSSFVGFSLEALDETLLFPVTTPKVLNLVLEALEVIVSSVEPSVEDGKLVPKVVGTNVLVTTDGYIVEPRTGLKMKPEDALFLKMIATFVMTGDLRAFGVSPELVGGRIVYNSSPDYVVQIMREVEVNDPVVFLFIIYSKPIFDWLINELRSQYDLVLPEGYLDLSDFETTFKEMTKVRLLTLQPVLSVSFTGVSYWDPTIVLRKEIGTRTAYVNVAVTTALNSQYVLKVSIERDEGTKTVKLLDETVKRILTMYIPDKANQLLEILSQENPCGTNTSNLLVCPEAYSQFISKLREVVDEIKNEDLSRYNYLMTIPDFVALYRGQLPKIIKVYLTSTSLFNVFDENGNVYVPDSTTRTVYLVFSTENVPEELSQYTSCSGSICVNPTDEFVSNLVNSIKEALEASASGNIQDFTPPEIVVYYDYYEFDFGTEKVRGFESVEIVNTVPYFMIPGDVITSLKGGSYLPVLLPAYYQPWSLKVTVVGTKYTDNPFIKANVKMEYVTSPFNIVLPSSFENVESLSVSDPAGLYIYVPLIGTSENEWVRVVLFGNKSEVIQLTDVTPKVTSWSLQVPSVQFTFSPPLSSVENELKFTVGVKSDPDGLLTSTSKFKGLLFVMDPSFSKVYKAVEFNSTTTGLIEIPIELYHVVLVPTMVITQELWVDGVKIEGGEVIPLQYDGVYNDSFIITVDSSLLPNLMDVYLQPDNWVKIYGKTWSYYIESYASVNGVDYLNVYTFKAFVNVVDNFLSDYTSDGKRIMSFTIYVDGVPETLVAPGSTTYVSLKLTPRHPVLGDLPSIFVRLTNTKFTLNIVEDFPNVDVSYDGGDVDKNIVVGYDNLKDYLLEVFNQENSSFPSEIKVEVILFGTTETGAKVPLISLGSTTVMLPRPKANVTYNETTKELTVSIENFGWLRVPVVKLLFLNSPTNYKVVSLCLTPTDRTVTFQVSPTLLIAYGLFEKYKEFETLTAVETGIVYSTFNVNDNVVIVGNNKKVAVLNTYAIVTKDPDTVSKVLQYFNKYSAWFTTFVMSPFKLSLIDEIDFSQVPKISECENPYACDVVESFSETLKGYCDGDVNCENSMEALAYVLSILNEMFDSDKTMISKVYEALISLDSFTVVDRLNVVANVFGGTVLSPGFVEIEDLESRVVLWNGQLVEEKNVEFSDVIDVNVPSRYTEDNCQLCSNVVVPNVGVQPSQLLISGLPIEDYVQQLIQKTGNSPQVNTTLLILPAFVSVLLLLATVKKK